MVKATKSGNFKPVVLPKPQTTVARCYSLIDIGTVDNIYLNKLVGKHQRIFVTWELPLFKAVFNEEKGEQPFVISEEFTLSTKDNSNFAKLMSQWRNKPFTKEEEKEFDPTVLVGKTCIIQFTHKRKKSFANETIPDNQVTNENTNLKIQSIMKRPNEMDIPNNINPYFVWDWEPIEAGTEKFDPVKFDLIPNFIKSKIQESEEYKKHVGSGGSNAALTQAGTTAEESSTVSSDDW